MHSARHNSTEQQLSRPEVSENLFKAFIYLLYLADRSFTWFTLTELLPPRLPPIYDVSIIGVSHFLYELKSTFPGDAVSQCATNFSARSRSYAPVFHSCMKWLGIFKIRKTFQKLEKFRKLLNGVSLGQSCFLIKHFLLEL